MLVTRPDPDASDTAARLGALGIEGVPCPLLVHQTLDVGLPEPKGFAAMAVTSANALRALDERRVLARYRELPLYAVGDRTAAMARDLGFAEVTSAQGAFSNLAELLVHAPLAGPIFYPAARDMSADLGKSLAPFGRMVITAEVYAMNPVVTLPDGLVEQLNSGDIEAALFYSKRTAQTFVRLVERGLDKTMRARFGVLCLSEAVAAPLLDAHFVRVGLADHPSEEAMMGLALSFARDQNP
ncbi:uroporphyrinogen-III synthase [Sphingomonas sp.]|uniref:uroporphyrinogen-III synthase n=1 Tax=Sphingomonas sp. TaxID=28214 RepID=UPI002FCA5C78